MLTTLTCVLTLSLAAPAIKEPPKKEIPSLIGEWSFVEGVEDGKPVPFKADDVQMTFEEKGVLKVRVKHGNQWMNVGGSYTLDTTKTPFELNLIPPPEEKEETTQAIYKIEGDTLTICGNEGGGNRPTEFDASAGKGDVSLMKFKRVSGKGK